MKLDHGLYYRIINNCLFVEFLVAHLLSSWLSRYSHLFEEVKEMGKVFSVCPACGCGCGLSKKGGKEVP
jgi:hypothetical protein